MVDAGHLADLCAIRPIEHLDRISPYDEKAMRRAVDIVAKAVDGDRIAVVLRGWLCGVVSAAVGRMSVGPDKRR